MSADANPAFRSVSGPPRIGHGSAEGQKPESSRVTPEHFDNSNASTSRLETSRLETSRLESFTQHTSFSSAVGAQAASLPGDWFETTQPLQASVDPAAESISQVLNRFFADQVTPIRLASHLSVLAVGAIILILSQVNIPDWNFSLRLFPNRTVLENQIGGGVIVTQLATNLGGQDASTAVGNEALQRATVPFTTIHSKEQATVGEIQAYTVQPGDTILAIADKFSIQPETILWANAAVERNPDLIRPGDQLKILPTNGVLHTVVPGDTLSSLAAKYKVAMEDILNYPINELVDPAASLSVGRQIVVPGGTKPFVSQDIVAYSSGSSSAPVNAKIGSGAFAWPTSGSVNQRYWNGHRAVDIGAWTGAPVKAADGGFVAVATGGWNGGYGNHVIIDHGNGFATLYAHLNSIFVRPGENISRGQQVGTVGNTGNSTGPHLHFEIRYQGVPRNPLSYLP